MSQSFYFRISSKVSFSYDSIMNILLLSVFFSASVTALVSVFLCQHFCFQVSLAETYIIYKDLTSWWLFAEWFVPRRPVPPHQSDVGADYDFDSVVQWSQHTTSTRQSQTWRHGQLWVTTSNLHTLSGNIYQMTLIVVQWIRWCPASLIRPLLGSFISHELLTRRCKHYSPQDPSALAVYLLKFIVSTLGLWIWNWIL